MESDILQITQHPIPSWGLGAISHRSGSGNRFVYPQTAGHLVTIFVLDTGIRTSHVDFGGRATFGPNYIHGSADTDTNGHGTHVAGTVAGNLYGVAKRAHVWSVKVLDHLWFGHQGSFIAAIQWVVERARSLPRPSSETPRFYFHLLLANYRSHQCEFRVGPLGCSGHCC